MHEHDTQENRVLEKLGDLARQQRTMMEHVLACPGCKAGLLNELAEDEARLEEPDYGAVLRHLEGHSPGLLHLLSEREAQAGELFRRLMVLPAAERAQRVRSGTVRSWPLVYRLLIESQRAQPQAPERSRELATGGLIKTAMASLDLARLAAARGEPVHFGRLVDEILTHLPHRARHLVVLAALPQRSIFRGHEGPEF